MQLAHFDGKLGEAVILRVVHEDAVVEVVQPAVADVCPYRLIFVKIQRDRRGLHLVGVGAGGEDVPVRLVHPCENRLAGGQRLIRLPLGKRLDADGGRGLSAAVASQTVADDGAVLIRSRTEIGAGIFVFRPAADICIPIPFNYHSCLPVVSGLIGRVVAQNDQRVVVLIRQGSAHDPLADVGRGQLDAAAIAQDMHATIQATEQQMLRSLTLEQIAALESTLRTIYADLG